MARRTTCSLLVWDALAAPPSAQNPDVNAPVAPDTIYVGRLGSRPGLSVIDLNGFGAGTGTPQFDPLCPIVEGNTNYPNNPNVSLQGALLVPQLGPGTTTADGGSEGVFRLTRAADLDDRLVELPTIRSVRDLALGHALDLAFNNGSIFGCSSGGGNPCTSTAFQVFRPVLSGPNTLAPLGDFGVPLQLTLGGGNPISWAPHPNPPALVDPPLCLSPPIDGEEPTSIDNVLVNLLAPGMFFGNPSICFPPTGLLPDAARRGADDHWDPVGRDHVVARRGAEGADADDDERDPDQELARRLANDRRGEDERERAVEQEEADGSVPHRQVELPAVAEGPHHRDVDEHDGGRTPPEQ